MKTLFDISTDLLKLNELLDECDDAEQQELIQQWLADVGDERNRKLEGYANLIQELAARAEIRRKEAERMVKLAQTEENKVKMLKERLRCFFVEQGLKTVETDRYKLSLTKNGGKLPLVVDDIPVGDVPEEFVKVSFELDKVAVREALETGETLEWARLGERKESVRIK